MPRPNTAKGIGKSELAAGCTFVAISRIHPMLFQRLKAISSGKNFTIRLQEQERLNTLQSTTITFNIFMVIIIVCSKGHFTHAQAKPRVKPSHLDK